MVRSSAMCLLCFCCAAPARAGEVIGGIYLHDTDTLVTRSGFERGTDIQLGYRWNRIGKTPLQPYVFGALNLAGDTHYAAAGMSAKFGDRFFVRPGFGIAIHSGSGSKIHRTDRNAFGSRILFEPEIGVGIRVSGRATIEASWIHMSHGRLFARQNPGIDNVGMRLSWKL